MQAVTIEAPAEDIWPWLAQMGYQVGELYSYDRLFGFLDRPSADRALVLDYHGHGMEWVWQFGLYPLDATRTRLVTRGTERFPITLAWKAGMLLQGTCRLHHDDTDAAGGETARRNAAAIARLGSNPRQTA